MMGNIGQLLYVNGKIYENILLFVTEYEMTK